MSKRMLLRVSQHRAYVWDVEGKLLTVWFREFLTWFLYLIDIRTLRSQHRVCGLLGGTLPHMSQQNLFLGVPLILLPEEVVLLVEKGMDNCIYFDLFLT